MKKLFLIMVDNVNGAFEKIAEAIEAGDTPRAIQKAVILLALGLGVLGGLALIFVLLYAIRGVIWKVVVLVMLSGVLLASYRENHKPITGPTVTKEPTMEQYVTVGSIVKMAAKRVAPMLDLSPIYDESDIKAAKDERIIHRGKFWLFKYRFLKKSIATTIDEDVVKRVFQSELRTVLDNENPAGFDKVRFVYGGVYECILQVDHVAQSDLYMYIYLCYASADYFNQREQVQEQYGHESIADTNDFDF